MIALAVALAILAAIAAIGYGLLSGDRQVALAVCWLDLRYATTAREAASGTGRTLAALGLVTGSGASCLIARAASAACTYGDTLSCSLITPHPRKACS
jgi:hypothetical protein